MFILYPLVLLLALFATSDPPVVHPHHPMAIVMAGVNGKVTFTYTTVDYNAKHKTSLKAGFVFRRGTIRMQSDIPLTIGGKQFEPGQFQLVPVRGKSNDEWTVRVGPPRRRGAAAVEATAPVEVAMKKVPGVHAKHLRVAAVCTGYRTAGRGSTEPAGGATGELHIGFGDLHQMVAIAEVIPKKKDER